jgi:hypothetical protein
MWRVRSRLLLYASLSLYELPANNQTREALQGAKNGMIQ